MKMSIDKLDVYVYVYGPVQSQEVCEFKMKIDKSMFLWWCSVPGSERKVKIDTSGYLWTFSLKESEGKDIQSWCICTYSVKISYIP
jgi:hypothetical protein